MGSRPEHQLVGVTAWGGIGKTAMVTHWVQADRWKVRSPAMRGVFWWSFYGSTSAEDWAKDLLDWAKQEFDFTDKASSLARTVLKLLEAWPVLLILDGLEDLQQRPVSPAPPPDADNTAISSSHGYGRLLDGLLREVLTGVCQLAVPGLVVLTSRFRFADLDIFDGGTARILQMPALTAEEGSVLLYASGGSWLADDERKQLVKGVGGHALAVTVLAQALAVRQAGGDLAALQANLAKAVRADDKVKEVLRFYEDKLAEADRLLIAAISLFGRPVACEALLAISQQPAFRGLFTNWTSGEIYEAARRRLTGVVEELPDGTLSLHPLIRDEFRPLALGAADAAASIVLAGLPDRRVTSRADAERVAEAIELLLNAGQWEAADDLYRARTADGAVFTNLPAAALGESAAAAFVIGPRRDLCETELGRARTAFYLTEAGERAQTAGDMTIAQVRLAEAVDFSRKVSEPRRLSSGLVNLTWCRGHLGETVLAHDSATKALSSANSAKELLMAHANLGWIKGLTGDSPGSDEQFGAADQLSLEDSGTHVHSIPGTFWAESLVRTGRLHAAAKLTRLNRETNYRNRRNAHIARCDRVLGRIGLAENDLTAAGERLAEAADRFWHGDYLVELAVTLADQAEYLRRTGDLDQADRRALEAIAIAQPRELIPALSAARSVRARIYADRFAQDHADSDRSKGRDEAKAALNLATSHHLMWSELEAIQAQARLDEVEGVDSGRAKPAADLYDRLAPSSLDPDPMATAEALFRDR